MAYPLVVDTERRRSVRNMVLPRLILVDAHGTVAYAENLEIKCLRPAREAGRDPPRGGAVSDLPGWLRPIARGRPGDHRRRAHPVRAAAPTPTPAAGAVLMLFGEGPAGPDLLLTERAHGMRSHPGQISFPGGSLDPTDASPAAAALREAEEETGLDPAGVEVFAELPELWLPPSNFAVTPVLAWWREESPVGVVDPAEVESVHRVPVEELLDATHRVTVTHPSRLPQSRVPDR